MTGSLQDAESAIPALIAAIEGAPDSVQVRDPAASDAEIGATIDAIRDAAAAVGSTIAINRRAMLARAKQVRWIHLGTDALDPARRGTDDVLSAAGFGVSVHSRAEAVRAEEAGAAWITFGHVFATRSHPDSPPRGLAALRGVVDAVAIPVLAIGGIRAANVTEVLATSVAGVAVRGAVLGVRHPADAVRELRSLMERDPHQPKHALDLSAHEGT